MARNHSCRGWKSRGKVCSLGTLAGQLRLDPGAIAQLVERFVRIEEVRSSNLLSSTDGASLDCSECLCCWVRCCLSGLSGACSVVLPGPRRHPRLR